MPNPMGVTWMSVFPRGRREREFSAGMELSFLEVHKSNEGNSNDYSHLIRLQYLIPIVIDDLDRDLTFIGVGHVIPGCGSVAAN
jgi:hypothetical protein